MTVGMRRRQFITLLGGAAAAWPLAARAQRPGKLPTIGYLGSGTAATQGQWTAALMSRLRDLGWIEGRTIAIEYRWAEGRSERFADIAAELVQHKVDVIVTAGTPPVLAAKQATSVIPIVFPLAGDPVGNGLVASLARPGGNVTGLSIQTTDLGNKRLELLREACARPPPVGDVMANVGSPAIVRGNGEVQADGPHARPRDVAVAEIRRAEDIAPAFETLKATRRGTLRLWRSARDHQPDSHQYLGPERAAANHVRLARTRRCRRHDVLWTKLPSNVPPRCRLGR